MLRRLVACRTEPRLPKIPAPQMLATVGVEVEGEETEGGNTGMKDLAAAKVPEH